MVGFACIPIFAQPWRAAGEPCQSTSEVLINRIEHLVRAWADGRSPSPCGVAVIVLSALARNGHDRA
jgi:hypothetical protein